MNSPATYYKAIHQTITAQSSQSTLIAVSKKHSIQELIEVYQAGCRHFGESRVQELIEKIEAAPRDIQWHLIGSLQRKKVPSIVGKVYLIHSVDSLKLAEKISTVSQERNTTTNILLQVNTSGEAAKHGFTSDELRAEINNIIRLSNLSIRGLMTMAPKTDDPSIVRSCFRALRALRDELQQDFAIELPELSMGMSGDYNLALDEGATLLRIGSAIFGAQHD